MLLTSGSAMTIVVSNTMWQQSKSVMIIMSKFPEQIKSQIIECAQILNSPFRHVWLFEWLILNKHCALETTKLAWIFYINGMCCIVRAVIFVISLTKDGFHCLISSAPTQQHVVVVCLGWVSRYVVVIQVTDRNYNYIISTMNGQIYLWCKS
jgi:hypothetical protein